MLSHSDRSRLRASFVIDNQQRRKNPLAKNDVAPIENDLARIDLTPYNA
jgi:hypothetical protein